MHHRRRTCVNACAPVCGLGRSCGPWAVWCEREMGRRDGHNRPVDIVCKPPHARSARAFARSGAHGACAHLRVLGGVNADGGLGSLRKVAGLHLRYDRSTGFVADNAGVHGTWYEQVALAAPCSPPGSGFKGEGLRGRGGGAALCLVSATNCSAIGN